MKQREAGEMTMVKRVANAIRQYAEARNLDNNPDSQVDVNALARAAIAAMREPSEVVKLAIGEIGIGTCEDWDTYADGREAKELWCAGVNAALAEHDAERLPTDARGVE